MIYILHIESSTAVCSVSLARNGAIVDFEESFEGQNHAKLIGVYIEQLLMRNDLYMKDLSAVAISKGPGSYTGLRIGTSHAKGICYAQQIPLIAIDPLQAMCEQVKKLEHFKVSKNSKLIPMMDARRMEVYTATYSSENKLIANTSAKIINQDSFIDEYPNDELIFFGNGASKCKDIIKRNKVIFIDDIYCSAKNMINLAFEAYKNKVFVDTAYFEPFYLKEFVAITSKKSVIDLRQNK